MEAPIFNTEGKKSGTIELPENVFGVRWNDALMHQVVNAMQMNARPRVAHARTRGEARGGGRKPWKQKGTGRARHGSIRSPIWRGGGVTHGPTKLENFSRTIPKKMRAKALFMALSRKRTDNELIFVDSLRMKEPKTALAKKTLIALSKASGLEKLTTKSKNAALIALSAKNANTEKSFRNIGNVKTTNVKDLNPVSVLSSTYLVIENTTESLAIISKRLKSAGRDPVKSRATRGGRDAAISQGISASNSLRS